MAQTNNERGRKTAFGSEDMRLLEEHGIKPTANRLIVARTLSGSLTPLTMTELEHQIRSIDKSGIYRVLTLFREHHLVHVIEGGSEGVKYELCHSRSHYDEDVHPHFFCEQCQKMYCIDNQTLPDIELPTGFEAHYANLIIRGICPDCRK